MRYLFCVPSAVGMLGPSVTAALELRARGHEVAFVTRKTMKPLLTEVGLDRIPYGPNDRDSFDARDVWKVVEAIRQVKHTAYACEHFAPDVLVCQALTWGAIAFGASAHLPVAVMGQAGYIWPTTTPQSAYTTYAPEFLPHVSDRYESALRMYKVCCQLLKIPCRKVPYEHSPLLGDLFLLQSIPELEGDPALLPERVHLIGDCTWNPSQIDAELQQWLEESHSAHLPIIYLQLSRVIASREDGPGLISYIQYLIETLGAQPVRVVASFGGASKDVTTLPENFLVREYVLQGQILPFAHAVICSGTSTNVLGAATSGHPIMIIPGNVEEPTDLAVRCARAGFGLFLPIAEATPEAIQHCITALLSRKDLLDAAQRLQTAFAAVEGPVLAADLLEHFGEIRTSFSRQAVLWQAPLRI